MKNILLLSLFIIQLHNVSFTQSLLHNFSFSGCCNDSTTLNINEAYSNPMFIINETDTILSRSYTSIFKNEDYITAFGTNINNIPSTKTVQIVHSPFACGEDFTFSELGCFNYEVNIPNVSDEYMWIIIRDDYWTYNTVDTLFSDNSTLNIDITEYNFANTIQAFYKDTDGCFKGDRIELPTSQIQQNPTIQSSDGSTLFSWGNYICPGQPKTLSIQSDIDIYRWNIYQKDRYSSQVIESGTTHTISFVPRNPRFEGEVFYIDSTGSCSFIELRFTINDETIEVNNLFNTPNNINEFCPLDTIEFSSNNGSIINWNSNDLGTLDFLEYSSSIKETAKLPGSIPRSIRGYLADNQNCYFQNFQLETNKLIYVENEFIAVESDAIVSLCSAFPGLYGNLFNDEDDVLWNIFGVQNYTIEGDTVNFVMPNNQVLVEVEFNGGYDLVYLTPDNTTKTNDQYDEYALSIYPNPSLDKVYIQTSIQSFTYSIFDIYGDLMLSGKNQNILDITDLRSGSYFLSLKNNDIRVTKRIIKL